MSWLRIDDGFSRHPKVTALSPRDRWTWVDILCYCARYKTGGYLPENIREFVAGATDRYLDRCIALELLDDLDDGVRVHDWSAYAPTDPTAAERQARWRRKSNGARNGSVTEEVTDDVTVESVTDSSTSRARPPSRPVLGSAPNGAALEVADGAQRIVGEFVDAAKGEGIDVPKRVVGQIAQAVKRLLDEGQECVAVRAGIARMVQRRIVQPSLLPNFVMEAALPVNGGVGRYGRGMTTQQILDQTRGME